MKNVDGIWTGQITGTNAGNAHIELAQQEFSLSGVVTINDVNFGIAVYNFTGNLDGDTITLIMKVDKSKTRSQPFLQFGVVTATGTLKDSTKISGQWSSSIGTKGVMHLKKENL